MLTQAVMMEVAESIGLMALVGVIYGTLLRSPFAKFQRKILLGVLFGAAAIISMINPVIVSEGIIIDSRAVFVGLGAAFGGWQVAGIAVFIAGVYRWFVVGGVGALPGTISITLAALLGYAWAHAFPYKGQPNATKLALAGALISLHFLAVYLLPLDQANTLMLTAYPVLLAGSVGGALVLGFFVERERRLIAFEKNLKTAADVDFLTNLANRRAFQAAASTLEQSDDENQICHVMAIFDLDYFKMVNDRYGHEIGDRTLVAFATLLKNHTRSTDIVARLGGEEFGVLLHSTSVQNAFKVINRILIATRALKIEVPDGEISVTVSAGAVEYWPAEASLDEVLIKADRALYAAKHGGRDRAEIIGMSATMQ